jgi:hypothetical protein
MRMSKRVFLFGSLVATVLLGTLPTLVVSAVDIDAAVPRYCRERADRAPPTRGMGTRHDRFQISPRSSVSGIPP